MTGCPIWALCLILLLAATAHGQRETPRPEHPRPDFGREAWLNLNGEWQWEVDEKGDGEERGLTTGHDLARRIIVPFCPESKLSGIGNTDYMVHTWYRRQFTVPPEMQGKRLLLHFGAVDWHARVWVNGHFVGEHRGGYAPFAFEVTDVVTGGENELVVHCYDRTNSGLQATGKQAFGQSEGCVYTRTTGIWQTVWLEAVGDTYLREFVLTPDVDGSRLVFQGWLDGPSKGTTIRLKASAGGKPVAETTFPAEWRATTGDLKLKEAKLWWPGKPFLYDLAIEVLREGKVVDSVRSYFGMRKISIEGNRFLINDKPVFQRLVLDQGFYPDGIYTAASDEALKHDIDLSMAAGFNGARLHQKVFEPRLLHWADRLGYMLWGEYPSWGISIGNAEAVSYAVAEWWDVVRRDRSHPSIIGWCPLNETGSGEPIAALQAALAGTQDLDPTRPFLDTSGYVHLYPATDVYDCHDYDQNPVSFGARFAPFSLSGTDPWNNNASDPRSRYRGQPFFVSEYGGIRLKTNRDVGAGWGYGETDLKGYLERYKGLTDVLLDNPNMCGFCYTQLTDIEQEQNGIYFYDRQEKYDPALVKAINARPAAYETQPPRVLHISWSTLVPTSKESPQEWRYTTSDPGAKWFEPGFDDSAWKTGKGGFGTETTPGAVVGTVWQGAGDIWLRRTFRLDKVDLRFAALNVHHDEDAEVYVNGQKVASFANFTTDYITHEATEALRKALKPGENTLAVHCRQRVGGQFIDVGIRVGTERK
jgi:ribosomal protein S19